MKYFPIFTVLLIFFGDKIVLDCLKYNVASFSELTLLTKEGKQLWESLSEKTKLPQYGSCWKNAVSDLRLGCKYLTEDVQSDLALRFADCFLQMSGYERMSCTGAKDVCLRNLSDRAFNAYTEFYTHTQSICYFLQSQVWHEETQKTIDKLSDTSVMVSAQLEEAGHVQRKILTQQKESLVLQHYLIDNGKAIASALELSEEKISKIMKDFQDSAVEQKKVLIELFEKLSLLRSLVVGEMSWINSVLFYMASMIIGYLFTSLSSTKQARVYILISLTVNYLVERFIYSHVTNEVVNDYTVENLNSWIWLSRKVFVFISAVILIYEAMVYCDYNIVNHKLLLEIKNQNKKILSIFEGSVYGSRLPYTENVSSGMNMSEPHITSNEKIHITPLVGKNSTPKHYTVSPLMGFTDQKGKRMMNYRNVSKGHDIGIDDIDNVSVISEKSEASASSVRRESPYNLRSSRIRTRN